MSAAVVCYCLLGQYSPSRSSLASQVNQAGARSLTLTQTGLKFSPSLGGSQSFKLCCYFTVSLYDALKASEHHGAPTAGLRSTEGDNFQALSLQCEWTLPSADPVPPD